MKRISPVLAVVLTVLAATDAVPGRAGGSDDRSRSFRLENGLRVFLFEKRDLPLVNVVLAFDVGSKDETDGTNGLVHLLEHCILFRGTGTRSGSEVSRDLRRHGAYFNAYTGQDLSLFELALPSPSAEFGLWNQKDLLFGLALTQEELDEEKEVVLEEINQMEDDPHRYAVELALRNLFPGHPYGRSVYGRREVISAATVSDLMAFHRKFFVPENGALAVIGDFRNGDMERMVRDVFGPLPSSGRARDPVPQAPLLNKNVFLREEKDVEGGTLVLALPAPDYNDPDQYAMNLLVEMMGRGVHPLLHAALQARRDLPQTLTMTYLANRFGGAVVISMRLDPRNVTAARNEVLTCLRGSAGELYSPSDHLGEAAFQAFDFLGSAKNQVRFAVSQSEESGLALAASMARFMLLNTRQDPGRYMDRILDVSSSDVRKVARKYFARGGSAAVAVIPGKKGSGS